METEFVDLSERAQIKWKENFKDVNDTTKKCHRKVLC